MIISEMGVAISLQTFWLQKSFWKRMSLFYCEQWMWAVGFEVWCRMGHLLTNYMGFSTSLKCLMVGNIAKGMIEERLTSWKKLYFSKGNAFSLLKVCFPTS